MAKTVPAWRRLVEEGWFASRSEAERWILSGKVRAGAIPVTSAGQPLTESAALSVRGLDQKYVSKGGLKLEGALSAFGVNPSGAVCIDAGASTGGFADCLVKHGAELVYAVDVGFGQLAGSLRAHPRVVNLERCNIGDETLLSLSPTPTLGTVDLSYLSLRKAVPQFARIMKGRGDLLCLVKPLFEIDDAQARRTGEIPQSAFEPLLCSLAHGLMADGNAVLGVTHSPVTGNNGTLEFFIWLSLGEKGGLSPAEIQQSAKAAALAVADLSPYHK